MTYAAHCESGPHPAGSLAYYNRLTGCYRVEYDSQCWYYRVPRGHRRAFRLWLLDTFAPTNGERYRVQGAYPNVTIERVRA